MPSSTDYLRTVARANSYWNRRAWPEAAAMWAEVVSANPVHGDHWDRLAHARFRVADYAGAIAAFERVLNLGVSATRERIVAPGEILYRIACCHARLGNAECALTTLGEAIDNGYRSRLDLLADDHLASLRDDPRLLDLVGTGRATELSRDDGWRLDLQFLASEVHRRVPARPDAPTGKRPNDVDDVIEAIPKLTDAQLVLELTKIVAQLDDGHALVEVPQQNADLCRVLPAQFYLFAEGLFVTATTPRFATLLGARVDAVDGREIADVIGALDPLLSRDNELGAKELVVQTLRRLPVLHAMDLVNDPGVASLRVRLYDGETTEVEVTAEQGPWSPRNDLPAPPGWLFFPDSLAQALPLYLRNCGAAYWFEHLPANRTVYFQFNSIRDDEDESIAAFSRRLFQFVDSHDVDRLVIDLRWNNGGNNMLVRPLIHELIRCAKVNRPGGLFVIIGRRTFSAAQYTATVVEAETHAIFVGEPTGSRPNFVGETTPFTLPYSGIRVNVSDVYWQNSWPLDRRRWIAPEIYLPPTFAAFSTNRDPAMEAILESEENLP
jgi:hypothetical protein